MRSRREAPLGELLGLGGVAAGCIAAGVGGGYWVGASIGQETVATLVGLGIGLVAAIAVTYVRIKRYL